MTRRDRQREKRGYALPLMASFALLMVTLTVWVCARNWPAASAALRSVGNAVTALLGRLWAVVPLPLSELLLLLLPLLAAALLVADGLRGGWPRLSRGLCRLLCVLCALLFCFVAFYGVQYTAPTLASRLGLTAAGATVEQLEQTTAALAADLNELAPQVPRDGNGQCVFGDYAGQAAPVMAAYEALTEQYPWLAAHRVATPKRSRLLSVAMSYVGNAGYFFPWTGESVVGYDAIDPSIAFNVAHESAHARGFGAEAECNFLAWLVCSGSADVRARYSAAFNAYIYAGNALYAADPTRWQAVSATLCDEAKLDLKALNAHIRQYDGPVKDLGESVNDHYIKATGQPEGLRSYGLMVDLLIAWNEREGAQ